MKTITRYCNDTFRLLLIVSSFLILFVPQAFSKELKIGLITSGEQIKIGSSENATLINLFNNQPICMINHREIYTVQNIGGLISVLHKLTRNKSGAFTGPIKLVQEKKDGLVFCDKSWYRGELIILANSDKKNITVINNIDLEDYLLSVVPSEIPHSWAKSALKAQSIAARSYTLGYLGRRKDKGYDLESTVEDQVYLGVSAEKRSTSGAVKETRGLILVDKEGKPLIALYHSSGGGYTDSIENLWKTNGIKASVHIQPRPDYDDNSPHFKWFRSYKIEEVNKLLNSLNIGEIKNIIPLSHSIAGRVTWIKILGTSSESTIRGEEFRKYLKLPSSKFNVAIEDSYVRFAGRGYGHGLGLSQWGAKTLSENGFTYEEILAHYYLGAILTKIKNNVVKY